MEYDKFNTILKETLTRLEYLFEGKNKEYANMQDVFANFKNASEGLSFHNKPEMVAWEYMVKHLQSIKDIANSDTTPDKFLVNEKINDAIMYLILMKGMLHERINEKQLWETKLVYNVS